MGRRVMRDRSSRQAATGRRSEVSGWVRRAYGERASELITELAQTMRAAETEAMMARTEEPAIGAAGTARQTLHDDLFELRNVLLHIDVSEDDYDRDLHL